MVFSRLSLQYNIIPEVFQCLFNNNELQMVVTRHVCFKIPIRVDKGEFYTDTS